MQKKAILFIIILLTGTAFIPIVSSAQIKPTLQLKTSSSNYMFPLIEYDGWDVKALATPTPEFDDEIYVTYKIIFGSLKFHFSDRTLFGGWSLFPIPLIGFGKIGWDISVIVPREGGLLVNNQHIINDYYYIRVVALDG